MIKSLCILLPALFLGLAGFAAQPADTPAANQTDDAYVLKVADLACPYCSYGIEKQFKKQEGVTGLDIDIAGGRVVVHVEQDKRFTEAELRQLVQDTGFELDKVASQPADASSQSRP